MELRPYQIEAIEAARKALKDARSTMIVLPTGAGKSVVMAMIAKAAAAKGNKTLILAHRKTLIQQTARTLAAIGCHPGVEAAGESATPLNDVVVGSIGTLVKRKDRWAKDHFSLVICDECFPAGTMIDGRPIEMIRAGDRVASFNHESGTIEARRVVGVLRRENTGSWHRITDSDGRSFVCTENHPVWTEEFGYVPAKSLCNGGAFTLMTHHAYMQSLPEGIHASKPALYQDHMLAGVPGGTVFVEDGQDQPGPRFLTHEGTKPHALCGEPGEDGGKKAGQAVFRDSRRKRQPTDTATGDFGEIDRIPHGVSGFDQNAERKRLTDVLQTGSGKSGTEARRRGGREDACRQAEGEGRQERRLPDGSRVARVEVYKPGSGRKPGWVPSSNQVYNLHVEGNENYFAEGILVHNCHHYFTGSWLKTIRHFEGAKIIGVTATPNRHDRISAMNLIESVCYEMDLLQLTEMGYLAPMRVIQVPLKLDLSAVKTKRGGDWDEEDLDLSIRPHLKKAAEALKEHAPGRKTLAFLPLIATSKEFAEECRAIGLRADYVSGVCKDKEEKLERFKRGELDVLANAQILTEGVDLPICDCIYPLRPVKSTTLFCQAVGRGTRLHPGKEDMILLDPMFLLDDHNLTSPARLVAVDDGEEIIIEEKLKEGKTLTAAKLEAAEEMERRRKINEEEKAKREARLIEEMAKKAGRYYRVKSLAELAPVLGWQMKKHVDRKEWQRMEPTAPQLEFLRKMGYPLELATSRGVANAIIRAHQERREKGLATFKQVKFLSAKGVPDPERLPFHEASEMIGELRGG